MVRKGRRLLELEWILVNKVTEFSILNDKFYIHTDYILIYKNKEPIYYIIEDNKRRIRPFILYYNDNECYVLAEKFEEDIKNKLKRCLRDKK